MRTTSLCYPKSTCHGKSYSEPVVAIHLLVDYIYIFIPKYKVASNNRREVQYLKRLTVNIPVQK